MLTEICAEIKNYFPVHLHGHETGVDIYKGEYVVSGGIITPLDFIQDGQYYRIVGSVFNDGVYQKPVSGQVDTLLIDETFNGAIWAMAVPPSVIALSSQIKTFNDENAVTPFTSESFGGYSYAKATGKNGGALSWQEAFADKLNPYRRMRVV